MTNTPTQFDVLAGLAALKKKDEKGFKALLLDIEHSKLARTLRTTTTAHALPNAKR